MHEHACALVTESRCAEMVLMPDCLAADPYDAVAFAKKNDEAKATTNALFCDAVAGLGERIDGDRWIVVLDGSEGTTCKHLQKRGLDLSKVLVPNIYTSSVASLRIRGVQNAFCCDVQDLLDQVILPSDSPDRAKLLHSRHEQVAHTL